MITRKGRELGVQKQLFSISRSFGCQTFIVTQSLRRTRSLVLSIFIAAMTMGLRI